MPRTVIDPLPFDLEPACEAAVRYVERGDLPSAIFGVVDDRGRREIVAISGRQEVHEDSVVFIASVTKAIVATAVMRYVDEGRLDLRAPLARYLPEAIGTGVADVSAWHILTHTSGLPDLPVDDFRSQRPSYQDLFEMATAGAPRWRPGTRYEYNSSAWVLLSELMATLSSSTFPEVLRARLLDPLGMDDTVFDGRPLRGRMVSVEGTGAENRLVGEALLWLLARARLPGGGMFGTAADLLRLGYALLDRPDGRDEPRILSRAAVAAMAEQQTDDIPHIAEDGTATVVQQGLGWRRSGGEWPPGERVLTHGGHAGARLWVDPERGFAFAFLTTLWGVPPDGSLAVLEAVYEERQRWAVAEPTAGSAAGG